MSDSIDMPDEPNNIVQFQSYSDQISGGKRSSQFKYSKAKFRTNLLIAIVLTAMVCGFTWMLLGIYGSQHMTLYTIIVGSIFFAFMSVKMLRQFIQDKIILAINPNGLLDARWSEEIIAWEKIKDISLGQREEEFILSVWLWPNSNSPQSSHQSSDETFQIDLEPLEANPELIVELINTFKQVRLSA